ncbi:MAG: hypothetical protein KKB37_10725 [Alphaproteobacteria bacterium]|nr:hypothetical protein [Alphaproteobacteria bacterium]
MSKKTGDRKPAAGKPAAGKTAAGKSAGGKPTSRASKSRPSLADSSDRIGLLHEQNDALRAELESAHARIKHLEDLSKTVADRIDWIIDSLQGVLKEKD